MITHDHPAFQSFFLRLQEKFNIYTEINGYKPTILTFKDSRKYIKLIKESFGHQSVYGFINKETGDVLKAASWSTPSKHARGNILNEDNGLGCCGDHSIAYLR